MKHTSRYLIWVAALLLPASWAQAAITCSITSPGFSTGYDPTTILTNINQTSYTISCNRASAADATSVSYSVSTDNGVNAAGQNNRAINLASLIRYDAYKNSLCSTIWKSNSPIAGTIAFTTTGTVSTTTSFWGCIPAVQTGVTSTTHTDTVTLTLSYGTPTATATGSYPVAITPPTNCQITTAPGNIAFTYTSFGPLASASTTFATTCTNGLPYTLALDATSATLIGLNYTLGLSAANATGTGVAQTFTITGGISAGQSGVCTTAVCTGTQIRTLTITY